jgi:hypothetical protein
MIDKTLQLQIAPRKPLAVRLPGQVSRAPQGSFSKGGNFYNLEMFICSMYAPKTQYQCR